MADNTYNGRGRIPSDALRELRPLVRAWDGLRPFIDGVAQFRIVIDSNIVIGDVLWLATKRTDPNARTSVLETIAAGTLEVYAPQHLRREVEEHLARIAEEEGYDLQLLLTTWGEYQENLKWAEPGAEHVELYRDGVDPQDAPFVALADTLQAAGVLSRDKHIEMMGGKLLDVEFVMALRGYSRAAAVELYIKCSGVTLGVMTLAGIAALARALRAVPAAIDRAPGWLQFVLLVGIVVCILHPGVRAGIGGFLGSMFANVKEATPDLVALLTKAIVTAESHGDVARRSLEDAMNLLHQNVG